MPYVVGHRGAAGLQPENTIEGFEYALALGCDYVECDVHVTRDGHLVVIHDETVDRTTNGTGRVAELTLAAIRQLDAGQGRRVPTFQEVLDVVRGRAILLCELKGAFTPEPTARLVLDNGLTEQVVFTSFHFGRLAHIKGIDKGLMTGALFKPPPADAVEQAAALGCMSASIHYKGMTADFVTRARALGLHLRVYNPDTEEDIQRMLDFQPTSVSSNRPDLVLRLLSRL